MQITTYMQLQVSLLYDGLIVKLICGNNIIRQNRHNTVTFILYNQY